MNENIFQPADILLPKDADMEKWDVIACDSSHSGWSPNFMIVTFP